MSEIALYRKYRPNNFHNLVGQDHIRQTLLNAIKGDNISHAYLFCGPRGTGKTTTARLMAKAVNCTDLQENGEPCEKCEMCTAAIEGKLIDLIEIDAASNRGIDEIRALKEKIKFSPTHAKAKIYIIDEVHMLSKDAFNALLKTLEEPPSHVYFILATTESHKVPETIISRCQRFDFKRVDVKSIVARLGYIAQQEKIEAELDALELIARNVEGGLRDAIGLLEQITFENKLTYEDVKKSLGTTGHKAIEQLFDQLMNSDTQKALATISEIHFDGYDLIQFTKDFLEFLREKMIESVKSKKNDELAKIVQMVDLFQKAYESGKSAVIPQLPLEVAVIKCDHDQSVVSNQQKAVSREQITDNRGATTASAPKPTPAPTPTPQPKAEEVPLVEVQQDRSSAVIDLSLDSVKKNFPRILENVTNPAIKMSFKTGTITKVDGKTITVGFSSNFHLDKVNNVQGHDVIERALKTVFGQTVKLNCELAKVSITPSFSAPATPQEERATEAAEQAVKDVGWDEI